MTRIYTNIPKTEEKPPGGAGFEQFLDFFALKYEEFHKSVVSYATHGKSKDPQEIAGEVVLSLFKEFSSGSLRDNFYKKLVEDKKEILPPANAVAYAERLIKALFDSVDTEELKEEERVDLKRKFDSYWRTLANNRNAKWWGIHKPETALVRGPMGEETDLDIPDTHLKSAEEDLLDKEYFNIFRDCVRKVLSDLDKKRFQKLDETYLSLLLKGYYPELYPADTPIPNQTDPDVLIKNESILWRIMKIVTDKLELTIGKFKKITGESKRRRGSARSELAEALNISKGNLEQKIRLVRESLSEGIENCRDTKLSPRNKR